MPAKEVIVIFSLVGLLLLVLVACIFVGFSIILVTHLDHKAQLYLPTVQAVLDQVCGEGIMANPENFGTDPIVHWAGKQPDGRGASCTYYQENWTCSCETHPTSTP